jgi:hypothetical protein
MNDDLVGHSIIPNMMSAIKTSILGGLDTILFGLPSRINAIVAEIQKAINKIIELDNIQNTIKSSGSGENIIRQEAAIATNTVSTNNNTVSYILNVNSAASSDDIILQYDRLRYLSL